MIVGVDFDGTVVEHQYPDIGAPVPGALDALRECIEKGDRLILWTVRSGQSLTDAAHYLSDEKIELFGVNMNPEQPAGASRKVFCDVYVDDAAIGCPLIYPVSSSIASPLFNGNRRPYVDWKQVSIWLNIHRNRIQREH